jgi:short-subunit dehydrogenase
MSTETVLVTGASSGIGRELARQFAKHGHPLVIVAPVQSELDAVAAELRQEYGVTVQAIAKDLEQEDAAEEIYDELAEDDIQIDILVNNAGHGQRGNFWEVSLERHISVIRLNVEAVIRLSRLFLPSLVKRGRGRVLNLASIAGFEPGPLMAVYHASKAFVLSWSEALATELKDTGVTVTALCPGPVDTDFFPKAEMVETNAFQNAKVMSPQEVAEAGYDALMRGERVYVPGGINKAMVFSRRFMSESAQAKMNEHMYDDAKEHKRDRGEIEAKAEAKRSD